MFDQRSCHTECTEYIDLYIYIYVFASQNRRRRHHDTVCVCVSTHSRPIATEIVCQSDTYDQSPLVCVCVTVHIL